VDADHGAFVLPVYRPGPALASGVKTIGIASSLSLLPNEGIGGAATHPFCRLTFSFLSLFVQVNYQYRNGTTFPVALRTLYADGGIPRFYRGVLPALVQGPLSRFGDTAANTGVLTLVNHIDLTKDMNIGIKTMFASAAAALFRIFLMPVDTVKTTMYVVVASWHLCVVFAVSWSCNS
jgi:hypothetical protein